MANSGKNSNTSQFFLTLSDNPASLAKLNGKGFVVFGKVVEDNDEVLRKLDTVGVLNDSENCGRPQEAVIVSNSGILF